MRRHASFVGIDVAKDVHWICAIDQGARVLIARAVAHDQEAIEALAADLRRLGQDLVVGLDLTGSIASGAKDSATSRASWLWRGGASPSSGLSSIIDYPSIRSIALLDNRNTQRLDRG